MKLKDLVRTYTNKTNNQIKFELKRRSLKEHNLNIDDLLNTNLIKDINKFKKGK
jgi:hypothetical protein